MLHLPDNLRKNTLNPVLPEVLLMSDGTDNERPLVLTELVTEQTNGPYCRKFVSTVGELRSVYSDDKNGVMIRKV